jgi:hypothetical protein
MSVNITEFYKSRQARHQQAVKDAEQKRASLQEEAEAIAAKARVQQSEWKKKESLKEENEREGVPTALLVDKLRNLATDLEALNKAAEAKRAEAASVAMPLPPVDYELMLKAARALAGLGCMEAVEVTSLDDCVSAVHVCDTLANENDGRRGHGLEYDKFGRPLKCWVRLDKSTELQVEIEPSDKHFLRAFVPGVLAWMPRLGEDAAKPAAQNGESGKPAESLPPVVAFVFTTTEQLIVSCDPSELFDPEDKEAGDPWSEFERSYDPGPEPKTHTARNQWGQEEDVYSRWWKHKRDHEGKLQRAAGWVLSKAAESIPAVLTKQLAEAGGRVDLSRNGANVGFVAAICDQLSALTIPTSPFAEASDKQESLPAEAKVKVDWNRIQWAPWSDEITGPLAKLKYLLENGDNTRFWFKDHNNHYGFRLRTRDHSWLVGQVFVDATVKEDQTKKTIKVHKSGEHWRVATLGRMAIYVSEEKG